MKVAAEARRTSWSGRKVHANFSDFHFFVLFSLSNSCLHCLPSTVAGTNSMPARRLVSDVCWYLLYIGSSICSRRNQLNSRKIFGTTFQIRRAYGFQRSHNYVTALLYHHLMVTNRIFNPQKRRTFGSFRCGGGTTLLKRRPTEQAVTRPRDATIRTPSVHLWCTTTYSKATVVDGKRQTDGQTDERTYLHVRNVRHLYSPAKTIPADQYKSYIRLKISPAWHLNFRRSTGPLW